MKTITIETSTHDQFINITQRVQEAVRKLALTNGVVTVFTPHTTCAITINENEDPDVVTDMIQEMDKIVSWAEPFYRHGGGNSASHIKTSLIGSSVQIIVDGGNIQLGKWQGLFLCEFDGPRTRQVWVN